MWVSHEGRRPVTALAHGLWPELRAPKDGLYPSRVAESHDMWVSHEGRRPVTALAHGLWPELRAPKDGLYPPTVVESHDDRAFFRASASSLGYISRRPDGPIMSSHAAKCCCISDLLLFPLHFVFSDIQS